MEIKEEIMEIKGIKKANEDLVATLERSSSEDEGFIKVGIF